MLRHLPSDASRRVLQAVGARHIVVHAGDLPPARQRLPELLAAESDHYRRVFQRGTDSVFSLASPADPTLSLLSVPKLPPGAQRVPRHELRARTDFNARYCHKAIDNNPRTFWPGPRPQARGRYFELAIRKPRTIVAFEIENRQHLSDLPLSFELSVAHGDSGWRTVAEQPVVRVYRDQIYSPKTFVFRVVLPGPVLADRLRISIGQPLPDHSFIIHEARVYAKGH